MIASGYQILVKQKAQQRRSLENLLPQMFSPYVDAPKPKTLTEISGLDGIDSELLLLLVLRSVLPQEPYVGKSCDVIFIDLNHKLDFGGDILKTTLMSLVEPNSLNSQSELTNLSRKCLESIIHMSCYTPEKFELALEELEDILWDRSNVSLLAIDGLDTFYWDDCHERLQRMSTHFKKLCQRLKSICLEHNICCIFTVGSNYLQSKCSNASVSSLVDYRLKLSMGDGECFFLNNKPMTM